MTKEELKEKLCNGFNVAMLAEAFDCSVGRINELKCEPVEGLVYHKTDINTSALFDFAVKHEINLDEIDFESIVAAKKITKEKSEIEVGSMTKFGEVIQIQKVGNSFVYLIKDANNNIVMKSTKDLK